MSGTLYDVLGVGKNATQHEIKSAYRRLALIYHPDTAPNKTSDHLKFIEIKNAYEILVNPLSRSNYDESLERVLYERNSYYQEVRKDRPPPPPYYYQRRKAPKYSRITYFYGAMFVFGIAIFAFLFPTYLMIKSANSHFERGLVYYESGMYSQALDNFTKSINDMGTRSGLANYYKAHILFTHYHNYQITNKYIDLALDEISDDSLVSELYWMKGKCYHLAGENDNALAYFKKVKDYSPGYDSSLFYSGIINTVFKHQYDQGLYFFNELLKRDTEHAESQYFQAYCLQKLENHVEAIAIYNLLLSKEYQPGAVYFHRALSELKLNKRDLACIDLDSAVNLNIGDALKLKSIYCP